MASSRNTLNAKKKRKSKRKSVAKVPRTIEKDAAKRLHDAKVAGAVVAYNQLQEANGGRLEHQARQAFLADFPGVTMNMIYSKQYRTRHPKTTQQSAGGSPPGATESEPVDDPMDVDTDEEEEETGTDATTASTGEEEEAGEASAGSTEGYDCNDECANDDNTPTDAAADDGEDEPEVIKASKKRGRPFGSTKAAAQALVLKKREVANQVACAYNDYLELKNKDASKAVPNRFVEILSEVCKANAISVRSSN